MDSNTENNTQHYNLTKKIDIDKNTLSDKNNNLHEDNLKSLQDKYDKLSNEIKSMESAKNNMEEDIKTLHKDFENINNNLGNILDKLDNINNNSSTGNYHNTSKRNGLLKTLIGKPLRKLAVGTLSGIYIVADRVVESAYDVKENAEDIFAEAQYKSKKRRMDTAEEN